MKKQHPQLDFTFITLWDIVLPTVNSIEKTRKYNTCVKENLHQINLQKYTPPPQLRQMSTRYKIMCGFGCYISAKSIHSSLLFWCDRYLKNSWIKAKILKAEGLVKNHITYMKHIKIK